MYVMHSVRVYLKTNVRISRMYVCTIVFLCIHVHRESESDVKVDPVVKWI